MGIINFDQNSISQLPTKDGNALDPFWFAQGSGQAGSDYNVLHDYATYNYVLTLAMISEEEWQSGSYKNKLDFIILQSGGKEVSATQFKASVGQSADTTYNPSWNFYVEKFSFNQSGIGTTGEYKGEMMLRVYEPYSLDQFIRACVTGARVKNNNNPTRMDMYNKFLMKIDFIGTKQDEFVPSRATTPKFLVMSMMDIQIQLTEKGTYYDCKFASSAYVGRSSNHNVVSAAITIQGTTVATAIKDLARKVNQFELDKTKDGEGKTYQEKVKQEIYIELYGPTGSKPLVVYGPELVGTTATTGDGNTVSPSLGNPMYDSDLDAEDRSAADRYARANAKNVDVNDTSAKTSKKTAVTITFNPEKNWVSNMIELVLMRGLWWYEMVKGSTPGSEVDMFELTTEFEKIPGRVVAVSLDPVIKVYHRVYIRKASPWRVSQSSLTQSGGPARNRVLRIYDYYYTGKNRDVVSFDLKFSNQFANTMAPQANPATDPTKSSQGAPQQLNVVPEPAFNWSNLFNTGTQTGFEDLAFAAWKNFKELFTEKTNSPAGSVGSKDAVANQGKYVFINYNNDSALLNANISILGDPIYITSSGGNYRNNTRSLNTSWGANIVLNQEGGVDFSSHDVYVVVRAKGVDDIDPNTGLLTGVYSSSYDAYYRVMSVATSFEQGKFMQTLTLSRPPVDKSGLPTENPRGI